MNPPPPTINAPERLSAAHDFSAFDSGVAELDDWLRRRALQNEATGASRTYVVHTGGIVIGYYSLAVGAVARASVPGRVRRNMPDPVPAMVLARLAVDRHFQDAGIGSGLLRDAILRTIQAAEIAGIRVILVHALSSAAKQFYEARGFIASPIDPMIVMITVADALRALG